jgi:hypothetical protein
VVRAAVSSHIASSGMKRRSSQKSSGEPSAENLHAGFCNHPAMIDFKRSDAHAVARSK